MFRKSIAVVGLLLGLSATAFAQYPGGGKVEWKQDPPAAMKLAKEQGRAMMLYFTSKG